MSGFYASNLVLVQATFMGILLALSIQVPLRLGVFSFAGVGCFGIGAYAAANMVLRQDSGAIPALVVGGLLAMMVGVLLGVVVNRLNGLYLAMATVAFDLMVGVVAVNGGEWTGGPTGMYGVLVDLTLPLIVVVVLTCIVVAELSERGRVGRRIEAVREDPELASSMGIRVPRYRLAAFAASGLLGGLAGALAVLMRTTIGPADIGFGLIVLALTMIIVGGALSWKGAVIGAVLFTWLSELLTFIGDWQELAYGFIVLLAGIFLPRGLYGLWVDTRRRISTARRERRGRQADRSSDSMISDPEQEMVP